MTRKFRDLFGRKPNERDEEPLGEDMAPSPMALAEHSALTEVSPPVRRVAMRKPFVGNAPAPIRDFTG